MNSASVLTLFLEIYSEQDVKYTYFLGVGFVPSLVSGPFLSTTFLPFAHLHSTALSVLK